MPNKINETIKKSQHYLNHIIDKLEDHYEDLSDETTALWHEVKPKLHELNYSLARAVNSLHTQTDEARLQAHLATMDAADQWNYLSKTVTGLARNARDKSLGELESAELQAHLAKMQARDFTQNQGKQISREYQQAKTKIEKISHDAAHALMNNLNKINSEWGNPR